MRWTSRKLTGYLATAPSALLVAYAGITGFCTYFCMYAFRKPYTAAEFKGQSLGFLGGELELKTAFVISQVIGYTLSKYLGIKFCSEAPAGRRAVLLVLTILAAESALLLFAVVPPGWQVLAIFLNGLPLGMVWGLVVWYLEGRRTSDLLLTALSCSYIVSSGVVKDAGLWLMKTQGVTENWMPVLTGALFLGPFLLAVWLLNHLPPPTHSDEQLRVRRQPMFARDRFSFMRQLWLGLSMLLVVFFFLTAYRDFRDVYQKELFSQLGLGDTPGLFTRTELPISLAVMAVVASLYFVRSNLLGLMAAYSIMITGLLLIALATALLQAGILGGLWWMILIGFGSYLAYIPHGSVLFDRMVAATRVPATAVFTIYLADAIGYTGSVGILLFKDLAFRDMNRLAFFCLFTYALTIGGSILLALSAATFARRARTAAVTVEPVCAALETAP